MKKLFLILALPSLVACITPNYLRSTSNLKNGLIVMNMDRRAFLDVWGLPDRTSPALGEKLLAWSTASDKNSMIDPRRVYDGWEYESRGIKLYFDGLYLIYWVTDRTSQQLSNPSEGKPEGGPAAQGSGS